MKKTDIARMQQQLQELSQIAESNLEKHIEVLQASFSAIATADPETALSIIDQLVEQKDTIKSVGEERERNAEMYIRKLSKALPPYLELEDEDNEDMN